MDISRLIEYTTLPWSRFITFFVFTSMALVALSVIDNVATERFFIDDDLVQINEKGVTGIHVVNTIVTVFQALACILVALSTIHIPHVEETTTEYDLLWKSHYVFFVLAAAAITSNSLVVSLFNNNVFVTIYDDDTIITNETFHRIIEYYILVVRIILITVATATGLYNFLRYSKPNFTDEIITKVVLSIVPFTGFIIGILHAIAMHPYSLADRLKTEAEDVIKERHLVYVVEVYADIALAVFSVLFIWSDIKKGSAQVEHRNFIANTAAFKVWVSGFYTAAITSRQLYALEVLNNDPWMYWTPFVIWGVPAIYTIYLYTASNRSLVKEFFFIVDKSYPSIFLWKIGITLAIMSALIIMFSFNARWFVVEFEPGHVPNKVFHIAKETILTVEETGERAFDLVKKLDPCTWNQGKGGSDAFKNDVTYDYSDVGIPKSSIPFKLTDADISAAQCHVSHDQSTCNIINGIKNRVSTNRISQEQLSNRSSISLVKKMQHFSELTDDVPYDDDLKECHSTECDTVLAVAIASELAIFASDAVSFLPGVSAAVDTAAWLAQMGNRIAYNAIMYGIKLGKFIRGLGNRISKMKPFFNAIEKIGTRAFEMKYNANMTMWMIYIPVLINGSLSFLLAFWRRKDVHNVMHTTSIVLDFFVPLILVNVTMILTLFIFPEIVTDILEIIPKSIMIITMKEHVGFRLMRVCYIISTGGIIAIMGSALTENTLKFREKARHIRLALRAPFKRMGLINTGADRDNNNTEWFDKGWYNAFVITMPIIIIFWAAWHYDIKFVNISYGPEGEMLKLVDAFHSHATTTGHVGETHELFSKDSLCGLVGKGVESVIHVVVHEVENLFEGLVNTTKHFLDTAIHFSSIVSEFKAGGKIAAKFLTGSWRIVEHSLLLIVPLMLTVMNFLLAFGLPHIKNPDEKKEVTNLAKQLTFTGIYYNVAMAVLLTQLFASLENVDLKFFYFAFEAGPLISLSIVCSLLNAVAMFSIFVDNIFELV